MGLIPGAPTIYEVLEELAITVQQQLVDAPLPFCAFNGGGDVFVDVGNKSLGLEALMQYLKFNPSQVPSFALYCVFTHHIAFSCCSFLVQEFASVSTSLRSGNRHCMGFGACILRECFIRWQHDMQSQDVQCCSFAEL